MVNFGAASILLLGGGYTLSRLAARLDPQSFVITATSEEKVAEFSAQGFNAALVNIESPESFTRLLSEHPKIQTLVDSVPPKENTAAAVTALGQIVQQSGISKIIYLSTSGVFGVTDGSWVDEETPANPQHEAAKRRLAVELAYREMQKSFTALRIPAIYGPGRGIGLALKAGTYQLIDGGKDYSNRIHVEDLASIIEKSLTAINLPPIFAVSDDLPAQSEEVVNYYCEKFKLKYPTSISREEVERSGHHTRLSNQRIRNALLKSTLHLELRYPTYLEGAGTEY